MRTVPGIPTDAPNKEDCLPSVTSKRKSWSCLRGFLYFSGSGASTNCQDIIFCGTGPQVMGQDQRRNQRLKPSLTSLRAGRKTCCAPWPYTVTASSFWYYTAAPQINQAIRKSWKVHSRLAELRRTSASLLPVSTSMILASALCFSLCSGSLSFPIFCTSPDACWEGSGLNAAFPVLINYLFHKASSWETS